MTADDFQRLALGLPEAVEAAHMGCTRVCLRAATQAGIRQALLVVWRNTAPKRLAQQLEDE
jgi:hypothetical protein